MTAECPYTLQWDAPFPLKIAPSHWGSGPLSNTWFPGPTLVLNPNDISIGSAVFAQMAAECSYALQWAAPSPPPLKLRLRMGDLDPI